MERHTLSKSTFIRGVQCLKSLYLYKKRYFLRDPLSAEQQAVFSRGTNVGVLARQLYPGGKDATPPSPALYARSVALTADSIAKGVEVIYEAAFQFEKVLVALDMLVLTPDGWVGIEVKSSRTISETYILDAALQYYVITGSGLKLADIQIMHINPEYERTGELVTEKLFVVNSLLEQVLQKQDFIHDQILREKDIFEMPHSPEIAIGLHCHNPYTCDFLGHCWKNYPRPTVFDLDAFTPAEQQSIFDQGFHALAELAHVPGLTTVQQIQIKSHLTGEMFLDKEALAKFINIPDKSIAFLKVLYCRPAVPLFDGTKPYQQLPFAFALFSSENDTYTEFFIIPPGRYPIEEFKTHLKERLSPFNCILVTGHSNELLNFFEKMNSTFEIYDLLEPFTKGMIYHPGLATGLSIAQLTGVDVSTDNSGRGNIQNDTMAGVRYLALSHALEGEAYSQELENIRNYALRKAKETSALMNWMKSQPLS
jgi:hypothetical protein